MRLLAALSLLVAGTVLAADTLGKTQVRTGLKNDLQAQLTDQGGTTLANIQANNTAPGAGGGLQVLVGNVQTTAPTYTAGNIAMPWIDTSGRLQIVTTPSGSSEQNVNLNQVLGSTISAANPVFVQMTNGTTAYTGGIQGNQTMANSFPVTMAFNQAPAGATFNRGSVLTINGGASGAVVCKAGLAVSQTTKPYLIVVSGMAAARCTLRYNDNGSFTNFADVFTSVNAPTQSWSPPPNFASLTTSATVTTQQYEANCSNIDVTNTDFECSIAYCQAASGC